MSVLEKALDLLGDESNGWVASFWPIFGPLFVLFAYSLAPNDPLIFGIGVLGLVLSTRWQVRGFSYALILLGLAAIAEHAFLTKHHLWQLGLEGAYAIAFFIAALSSQQRMSVVQSLSSHIDAREASIRHLEDELAKMRESDTAQQLVLQDKIALLQQEIEEAQSEHASLLILNEVLRKTAAIHGEEKGAVQEALRDAQIKMAFLQEEFEKMQREVERLSDANPLAVENRNLTDILNAARFEKEQARLISETLAREHARENLRAKEAMERWRAVQEESSRFKQEVQSLNAHLDQMRSEREQYRLTLQKLEEMQTERNFLKERLEKAALLPNGPSSAEFAHLQEKVAALIRFESLYKQLKVQFEEKKTLLHQTRTQLFYADTELQTLKIEKERKELQSNPLPEEIRSQIVALEEELSFLDRENKELQNLVTTLVDHSTALSRGPGG